MRLIKRFREGGYPAHIQWGNERDYACLYLIFTWGAWAGKLRIRWRKRNNPARRPQGTGNALVLTWKTVNDRYLA